MYFSAGVISKTICLCAAATGVCLGILPPQPTPPDEFGEKYTDPSASPHGEGYSAGHPIATRLLKFLRFDYNAASRTSFLSYFPYLFSTSAVFMSTLDIFHTLGLFPQIIPIEHTAAARTFNGQLIIGLTLTVTSSAARLVAFQNLGRFFTYRLSILPDHKLITHGLYSHVRHPSYTAILTLIAGVSLTVTAPGSVLYDSLGVESTRKLMTVIAVVIAVLTRLAVHRTGIEDQVLREEFKEEWEGWARVVKYKFIPGVL